MDDTYFISYTGEDEKYALWIAGVLEAQGRNVLIQAWDMRAGSNFYSDMHDFLIKCDIFIAVLSQAYFESKWCKIEWSSFCKMAEDNEKLRFIPVRITDVEPIGVFADRVYIDLYDVGDDKERESKLLVGLEKASREKPSFPDTHLTQRTSFPGALLKNNLPERNLYFSGREVELNNIHAVFQSGVGCIKQTITGLGGVGKTQTAIEYAWRNISRYKDAVWLANAETETAMWSSFLAFAGAAGIITENVDEIQEPTPEQLAGDMKAWFAAHNSWLLIIDNVEDNKTIAPYITGVQSGHILITTRNRELKQGKQVGIDLFTHDEAVQFMRDRLSGNADLIDSGIALDELIGRMNSFPLALEQAGAYMESTGRNCSDYLGLLDKRGTPETLAARKSAPTNYHIAVTQTLSLTFDKLGESARQLFNLCTFMAPDRIPLGFFGRQAERLPEPLREDFADDFEQDEIIAELLNYSLVKRDGDYLNMHRLVQEIGRDQLNDRETDWLGICLDAVFHDLLDMGEFNSREQRERFAGIADHGLSVAVLAESAYVSDADREAQSGHLYYLLGCGSLERARYEQAMLWFEKSLSLYDKSLGIEHPVVSFTCTSIASIYDRQRSYSKALEWRLRGLDILEKTLGEGNPATISLCTGIALSYASLNDYSKALEYNKKALMICERELGVEHPDTAGVYKSTAFIYNILGDYPKAMEWYKKALSVNTSVLGEEHPSTAFLYSNIAHICYMQSDYTGALDWYRKVLAVYEKVLGAEHPETAKAYNDVAKVSSELGDIEGALEWYQKALTIREKVLGIEHPDVAETYRGMAYVCYAQGDYTATQKWLRRVLAIFDKVLDANHPDVAQVCDFYAMTCQEQGDYPGALEWYQKALAIREGAPDMDPLDFVLTYSGIALVFFEQGDYSMALEWYEKSYRIMLGSLGDSHPGIAPVKANMEIAHHEINPDESFEKWLERKFSQAGTQTELPEGGEA